MDFKMVMSEKEIERRLELILDLPFHRFLDFKILKTDPGYAEIELGPTEKTVNAGGVIHGGILYTLLDSVAYLAMLPLLKDNQNGVTHDIHVSVLNPAPVDKPLILKGTILKISKRIVFGNSEAFSGNKLIASGKVTKSVLEIKS